MTLNDAKTIAMELLIADFARLHDDALAAVPDDAQRRIGELESILASTRIALEQARRERDAAHKQCTMMLELCETAKRWRKDRFSPRLEQAIDRYSIEEVRRRP